MPDTVHTSDEALMQRLCATGEEAALAELMHRWEIPVKRYLARMLQNRSEAEDLAQETFVRLYQTRDRFREGADFSPWLFTLAVNLARNRLRWWRRRPTTTLEGWEGHDPSLHAAQQLEHKEVADLVRTAVGSLPVGLREVVVLCEFEGLKNAAAAAVLGLTEKAVERRLSRARELLRSRLGR